MKNLFKTMMLVAVAAMGFTACSNNDVEEVLAPSKQTKKITVVSEITRTEFNSDLTKLVWSEGDTFGVFTDVEADDNIQSSAYAANTTDFVEVNTTATKVYAYYPYYSKNNSENGKTATEMSVGIPGTQTQSIAGQLTTGNLPMVAQGTIEGDKVALSFRPIATVLGFNIYHSEAELTENIVSIKFTASGEEKSSGYDYTYNLTNSEEAFTPGYQYTTLDLEGDAQFVPGTKKAEKPQAYMVVNKIAYSAGVEIVVTTEGGITYTFTSKNTIDCTETYRTMNLNLNNATKVVPEVVTGPYVSDSIFTCSEDDSTNAVYSLQASKVGEEDATGFKLGTTKLTGSFTSEPVGVTGDKYLVFYGTGWKEDSCEITIKVNGNIIETLTLNANSSVSGNAPYIELNFPASDFHYVQLTNLAASDKITFSTTDQGKGKRAVLCGVKLSDEVPELPASLTVTPTELSFDADGGDATFTATLENSEDEITVTVDDDAEWLTVEKKEGTTYTVTADPYTNTEENRIANITVKAGKLSKTITVTQTKYVDPNAGGGNEVTATFAPRNVNASNKTFTDDQNNSWVFTSDAAGFTSSGSYIHAGSGSKKVSHITFDSNINNVTKVTVNAAAKANSKVTIKVYIGEELIGESSVLGNTAADGGTPFTVENTENKQGPLKIVVSRPSATKAAIYFNQAKVTYTK